MPRATANSSSTIRMVAHGAAILHRARRRGGGPRARVVASGGATWRPAGERAMPAPVAPPRDEGRVGRPTTARNPSHARPTPPRGREPHGDRQEGVAPSTRRPPAGGRLRPRRRQRERVRRRARVRAAQAPRRGVHPRRPAVDGGKTRPVLVHAIQVNPITRRPIHIDLFAVQMTEELTVEVQLVGTGVAPAIELGGTLVHPVSSVKVRALPDNLPESLHYDLSTLVDYDATVTVADLQVPEGVTVQADEHEVDRPGPGAARRGRGGAGGRGRGCRGRGCRGCRGRRGRRVVRGRRGRGLLGVLARSPRAVSRRSVAERAARGRVGDREPEPEPVGRQRAQRARAGPPRRPRASPRPSSRTGPRRRTGRGTRGTPRA